MSSQVALQCVECMRVTLRSLRLLVTILFLVRLYKNRASSIKRIYLVATLCPRRTPIHALSLEAKLKHLPSLDLLHVQPHTTIGLRGDQSSREVRSIVPRELERPSSNKRCKEALELRLCEAVHTLAKNLVCRSMSMTHPCPIQLLGPCKKVNCA